MPAISTASAPVSEAILPLTAPADPQAGKFATQTFTSLLGTLMGDGEPSTQPDTPKKLPTEVDSYAMQLTNPPVQPAQPIIVPVLLRMHFFFPATSSAKVATPEIGNQDAESNPQATAPVDASAAVVPVATPVVVAAAAPQIGTTPAPVPDAGAIPASVSPALPKAPPVIKTAASSTPVLTVPRRTVPTATANPVQDVQSFIPLPLLNEPLPPQPKAPTTEPQSRSSTPTAAEPKAVQTTLPQVSSGETMKAPSKDISEAAQFSVKSEGTAPLPQAQIAFAAKLTLVNPQTVSDSTPPAVSLKAPIATTAPVMPSVSSQPAETQTDTQGDGEPAPAPKQFAKVQVKVPVDSEVRAPQSVESHVAAASTVSPVTVAATLTPSAKAQPDAPAMPPPHAIDARPEVAALPDTNAMPKSEPVRDLSIRIGDNPSSQVDVKIQERAGEIHVAVLTNNPSLTTDMRQQVGDLVGKLDRAGYHAETFKSPSSVASQQSSNASDAGQQHGFSGGQQQQQEEARQQFLNRTKRSNQAQWLQQMNGNFGPTAVEGIEQQ